MASGRELAILRQLLGDVIAPLSDENTHRTLGDACEQLGLPAPTEEGSKRERVERSLAALTDSDLTRVAKNVLAQRRVVAQDRNAIQDLLWAEPVPPEIPKRTRRELARDLDLTDLVHNTARFTALLDRFWVLDDDPLNGWLVAPSTTSLRARIERHVFRNPGDWTTEDLLENLGAYEAGNARFTRFLEGLVSADVIPDESVQRRIVATINAHVRGAAIELRETGTDGGYPLFSMVSTRLAHNRRPKNLIFATLTKPDLRFLSAIDNDIEIVGNADSALVYDRPIDGDGIRWRDLQNWWQDTHKIPSETEAKKSLYTRLRRSLPDNSPGQQRLFTLYHEIFGPAVYNLPALLPEVWLHWDHKTVRERGPEALLRFRMDFLLLLPHGQRIVLEVDGSQHYTSHSGQRPDSSKYAALVAGDRDLKLSGYEVFRFGSTELAGHQHAHPLLRQFFTDLFRRFDVATDDS